MTRGMALVLTLLVITFAVFAGWYSGQRTDYFPASLQKASTPCQSVFGDVDTQQVLDEFEDQWFSGELSAFGEPSLYRRSPATPRTIRFTWLRSFHDPVVVRIDGAVGGRLTMTARRRPAGHGWGVTPGGGREQTLVRPLSSAEASALQATIAAVGLLEAPVSGCRCCVDGARWIIEVADPRRGYRYHSRQSPKDGLERAIGLHLLALTGWDVGEIY